jgi:hypothetical protein
LSAVVRAPAIGICSDGKILERFVALVPDWDELSAGLRTIVLDAGGHDSDGWHSPGVVAIRAWERGLWVDYHPEYVREHQALLDRLQVNVNTDGERWTVCWTEPAARAFQLVHVFLHELGHHHDRLSTRSRKAAVRGEAYAERYANQHSDQLWHAFAAEFGNGDSGGISYSRSGLGTETPKSHRR